MREKRGADALCAAGMPPSGGLHTKWWGGHPACGQFARERWNESAPAEAVVTTMCAESDWNADRGQGGGYTHRKGIPGQAWTANKAGGK